MRRIITVGVAVLVAALAAGNGVARAGVPAVSCDQPTTPAFTAYADSNSYFQAPDGNLERGAAGWTLTAGAELTPATP